MAKINAFGTVLKRGATAIAQVQDIDGPDLSLDTEDVTSHDSTGGWEEVVATILRSGELSYDIVYDPANATHKNAAAGLIGDMVARTATTYSMVFPDVAATTWSFSAFVTGFKPSAPVSGKLAAAVKMKITGQPTLV